MRTPPDGLASAVLDSLVQQLAVIDATGRILFVNSAWIEFGTANGMPTGYVWEGRNYFDTGTEGDIDDDASAAADGIRRVLSGRLQSFSTVYPCHSPEEQRWFTLRIVPLTSFPAHFVISHDPITERVLAEQKITEMYRSLERAAISDSLTGVLNRRGLEAFLRREIKRCERLGARFSVALIDIDHFKSINDSLGHCAGDNVICRVARELQAHCREYDAVGRWGGDEFLIVLPATGLADAHEKAERFRVSIRAPVPETGYLVSISYGVLEYEPGWTLEDILEHVDAALYEAKRRGRDQGRAARMPAARPANA
jgi:diguanylate cyclase (GGDEF)-like protein